MSDAGMEKPEKTPEELAGSAYLDKLHPKKKAVFQPKSARRGNAGRCRVKTFTVRYKERNGRYVERLAASMKEPKEDDCR